MRDRLRLYLHQLRSSYWFVPAVMAISAMALSLAATRFDQWAGDQWIREVRFLYQNEPAGARALLSTVAGSMIGVAGVTFSITIVSVVYASGQYGPRVISNFMADSGNQVTLGTFIATFLYCILVLRTVRTAQEASADIDAIGAFVPHVAVLVALFLAVASIAVLIFFIHHVPRSIHVSNVIAGIGRELEVHVESLFPERIGDPGEVEASWTPPPDGIATTIKCEWTGFIQSMGGDLLVQQAKESDVVVRGLRRPGDFVSAGDALLTVYGADSLSEDSVAEFRNAFVVGATRTALQDVRFPADELVEMAVRALSPGVNDPYTAFDCISWLISGFKAFADRKDAVPLRWDADEVVRLVAEPTTFEGLISGTLTILIPHARRDLAVCAHLSRNLSELLERTTLASRREVIQRFIDRCSTTPDEVAAPV